MNEQIINQIVEDNRVGDLKNLPINIREIWHKMLLPHRVILEDLNIHNVESTLCEGNHYIHIIIDRERFFIIFKINQLTLDGLDEKVYMIPLDKNKWESALLQESDNKSNMFIDSKGNATLMMAGINDIDREISLLDPDVDMGKIDKLLDIRNIARSVGVGVGNLPKCDD